MLEEADIVLTMNSRQATELCGLSNNLSYKIFTLPEYINGPLESEGISDPHGYTMAAHRACVRQLSYYLGTFVERLNTEMPATRVTTVEK